MNKSIYEISESFRKRTASPVTLMKSCLDVIERRNPEINAFITVLAETALQEAHQAEKEIATGKWRGPLHGVPVGVKDFYDTAGVRTTAGFEQFKNRMPRTDAVVVQKLKEAGAIIVGKTNMDCLGMATTGLESDFGSVRNPRNPLYITGGSSSGSAAAVASGMCYATIDTDAIGSCRLPAACCGVVGFKGSYGLIDQTGILVGEQPPDDFIKWMGHAGVTTRWAMDTALILDVLLEKKSRKYFDVLTTRQEIRVGIATVEHMDNVVQRVFGKAVSGLELLNHFEIKKSSLPQVDLQRGLLSLQADRASVAEKYFKDVDVILLPTLSTSVPETKKAQGNPQALSAENTLFANYYGLPAISVPCGVDEAGLPIAMQIVGRPGDEDSVIYFADRFQKANLHTCQ